MRHAIHSNTGGSPVSVGNVCATIEGKSGKTEAVNGTAEQITQATKKLSPGLRTKIIDGLRSVSPESFSGYAYNLAGQRANEMSNAELMQVVLDIQDQIKDNREMLRGILGNQFSFFDTIKF